MRDDNPIYENITLFDHRLFDLQKYVLADYAGEVIPSHFHFMPEIMWFRQAGGSFTINDDWHSERPSFMQHLLQVLQQMERENRFELGTLEAAQRCGVSKSYFSRRFKAHFGMTFKEYLLVRKLKSAVGLLLAGERKIADIAEATGFTDSAYFTLKFRTLMGCTPSEFRLQAAGERQGKSVYPPHSASLANDFFISDN